MDQNSKGQYKSKIEKGILMQLQQTIYYQMQKLFLNNWGDLKKAHHCSFFGCV